MKHTAAATENNRLHLHEQTVHTQIMDYRKMNRTHADTPPTHTKTQITTPFSSAPPAPRHLWGGVCRATADPPPPTPSLLPLLLLLPAIDHSRTHRPLPSSRWLPPDSRHCRWNGADAGIEGGSAAAAVAASSPIHLPPPPPPPLPLPLPAAEGGSSCSGLSPRWSGGVSSPLGAWQVPVPSCGFGIGKCRRCWLCCCGCRSRICCVCPCAERSAASEGGGWGGVSLRAPLGGRFTAAVRRYTSPRIESRKRWKPCSKPVSCGAVYFCAQGGSPYLKPNTKTCLG